MKLISNLDVNGNYFVNGSLQLKFPAVEGEQFIATHAEVEAVINQFSGAFLFQGNAKSISQDMKTITKMDDTTVTAAKANKGWVFQISDKEYASNGSEWVELGFNIPLATASNDGLMSSSDFSKLSGIASGAQVNVIESVQMNGTALAISSKAVNIPLVSDTAGSETVGLMSVADKTKLDGLESGAEVNVIEGVKLSDSASALTPDANKIVTIPNATTSADGLMSSEDKTKLNGVATGAQVNVVETVKVNGSALTPDANKAVDVTIPILGIKLNNAAITPDANKIADLGYLATKAQLEETERVAAAALNDLDERLDDVEAVVEGIEPGAEVNVIEGVKLSDSASALTPDANKIVTIPNATTSADGLMSSEDKTKLNGIAAGAEVNVQADWSVTDTTSDAYIANKPTNMAVTYLATPTTAQYTAKSMTIPASTHGCREYPMVIVYAGNTVVSADVTVDITAYNDVTVAWQIQADANTNPIHVRIVG